MYLCNYKIPLLPCAPYPCVNLSFTLVSACGVANMSYRKATLFISNLSMNLWWFYAIPILMKEALSNMEKHTYPLSDMCFWFIMLCNWYIISIFLLGPLYLVLGCTESCWSCVQKSVYLMIYKMGSGFQDFRLQQVFTCHIFLRGWCFAF
jgi:hypothetical protein